MQQPGARGGAFSRREPPGIHLYGRRHRRFLGPLQQRSGCGWPDRLPQCAGQARERSEAGAGPPLCMHQCIGRPLGTRASAHWLCDLNPVCALQALQRVRHHFDVRPDKPPAEAGETLAAKAQEKQAAEPQPERPAEAASGPQPGQAAAAHEGASMPTDAPASGTETAAAAEPVDGVVAGDAAAHAGVPDGAEEAGPSGAQEAGSWTLHRCSSASCKPCSPLCSGFWAAPGAVTLLTSVTLQLQVNVWR